MERAEVGGFVVVGAAAEGPVVEVVQVADRE
jgi:hypothetical protein